jgi:hypothetical protein
MGIDTIYELPFGKDEMERAYIGKPHECMCGCVGEYYECPDIRADVVYDIITANAPRGIQVIDNYIFTVYLPRIQYTIYLPISRKHS